MNLDEINVVLDVVSQELRGAELVAAYDEALYRSEEHTSELQSH